MPSYQYSSLEHTKSSFRLLKIRKGHQHDDIYCRIFESQLPPYRGHAPSYKALSYTWDSIGHTSSRRPDVSPRVLVDDHDFHVTDNLFSALHQIRCQNQDVVLWVDAICINQTDPREKGHQVKQMGAIYARAEEVLVWLGPSNDEIASLMDLIASIDDGTKSGQDIGRVYRRLIVERAGTHQPEVYYSQQRHALAELLMRPWFKRVWILQEVAKTRSIKVLCGSSSCSARIFVLIPSLMELKVSELTQAVLELMSPFSPWQGEISLSVLLQKFSESQASVARDKVYALLSISADASKPEKFYPCYEKSDARFFRDTASFVLFGGILDSRFSFPEFTMHELSLPLTKLAEKLLDWAFGPRGGPEGPARLMATLLVYLISKREPEMKDLLRSLAGKRTQLEEINKVLSPGRFHVRIRFEETRNFLEINSEDGTIAPVRLVLWRHAESPGSKRGSPQQHPLAPSKKTRT